MHPAQIILENGGIFAKAIRIVDEAQKRFAVLVRLITEDIDCKLICDFLLIRALADHLHLYYDPESLQQEIDSAGVPRVAWRPLFQFRGPR